MREMLKMILVLTLLSSFSGGILAALKDGTKERIENQELELVKGPAIRNVLDGCSNDPVSSRIKIMDGNIEKSIFIGVFNETPNSVAFETFGNGFADKLGIIIGVDLKTDNILGIEVTTHKETPGLGANAKDDPSFAKQFKKFNIKSTDIMVTTDGGKINALSGATITSRAICTAIANVGKDYTRLKSCFNEKLKNFSQSQLGGANNG